MGAQADGGIERLRAVVKQIERPDVDGAARQIDSRRSRSRDTHAHIIIFDHCASFRPRATSVSC